MALVPGWNQPGPGEVWFTLRIRSPKSGEWVSVQSGTAGVRWISDLGFNPYVNVEK